MSKHSTRRSIKVHTGKEVWKDVVGYKDFYQVSKSGRVKSLERTKTAGRGGIYRVPEKILVPIHTTDGYLTVNLYHSGSHRARKIHRLVLEAFVGPCSEGMECRHLDGNRKNNRLDNLCWGTRRQQYEDREKHGTTNCGKRVNAGEANGMSRMTEQKVWEIRLLHDHDGYSVKEIAVMVKENYELVRRIVRRERWNS